MLAGVAAMLPMNPRGMSIGTFHGRCNRLLRAHHREEAQPAQFQILDAADQLAAIKRLMKALQMHNFEVIMATRAEDALQVMIRQTPKLIVSETIFPPGMMGGFAFYKKIQEHPALYTTLIFFLTLLFGQ